MKIKSAICKVHLAGLLLFLLFSCKKEAIKGILTITVVAAVTNITATAATCEGEIKS